MDGASGAIGDVAEMTEQGAEVAFFDFGVQLSFAADGIDEVLEVGGVAGWSSAFGDFHAFPVVNDVTATLDVERTFLAVEGDLVLGIGWRAIGPAAIFPCDGDGSGLGGEIEGDRVGVRRFLIVVGIADLGAATDDASGIIDAEAPADHVEGVDAVVAELAVAPVPEPVPIVVNVVGAEFLLRSGALPERPIQASRNGAGLSFADRRARIEVIGARAEEASDFARAQALDGFADPAPRAALRAVLNVPLVFAGGFDEEFAFARVMGAEFFEIDVLAGAECEEGGGSVPVIGRGDGDGVDLVFERFAEITNCLGPFGAALFHGGGGCVGVRFVDVADVGDFDILKFGKLDGVGGAAAGGADDGNTHEAARGLAEENGGECERGCGEETPTVHIAK